MAPAVTGSNPVTLTIPALHLGRVLSNVPMTDHLWQLGGVTQFDTTYHMPFSCAVCGTRVVIIRTINDEKGPEEKELWKQSIDIDCDLLQVRQVMEC